LISLYGIIDNVGAHRKSVIIDTMTETAPDLRSRIVRAAADLLRRDGRAGVSTRAVSAAAGVQAPAIYRQFTDMTELLHAAAREVFAGYVREKSKRTPYRDPLEELRHGWDAHVGFGIANAAAYLVIYADAGHADSADAREGYAMLEALVSRVAEAGQLRVSVSHAARLIHAGACGVTLSLIGMRPEARDPSLSTSMRDLVLAGITVAKGRTKSDRGPERIAARAVAMRAVLGETDALLSPGERQVMGEWLDRLTTV
jgi:AcrR family transcriptional regulator